MKIGVLIENSKKIDYLTYGIINKLCSLGHNVVLLKLSGSRITKKSNRSFFSKLVFSAALKIEMLILRIFFRLSQSKFQSRIIDFHLDTILIDSFYKGSFSRYITDSSIIKIKNHNFDILFRCCNGILRGEILNSSKLGLFSFHHGDHLAYRGGPAGFWEVYNRESQTHVTFQKLNEELDNGYIVNKIGFQTKQFFLLNQYHIFLQSIHYLDYFLNDITGKVNFKSFFNFSPIYKLPTFLPSFRYLAYVTNQFIVLISTSLFHLKRNKYKVYYKLSPQSHIANGLKTLDLSNSKCLNHDSTNCFVADPFFIHLGERDYCFVEEFDYNDKKGKISVYDLNKNLKIGDCIIEDFHLSYPNVFTYKDEIYMIPEASASNQVRLYKCVNFPLEWKLERVLISGVKAVDVNIIIDDKVYLIFNIDRTFFDSQLSEMNIFFNNCLLSDHQWISHRQNPIRVNSNGTRNGGLMNLSESSDYYRFGQVHGFSNYGESLNLYRINIGEKHYDEQLLEVIRIKGRNIHHIHVTSKCCVYDIK